MSEYSANRYHLPALDRQGLLLGLGIPQLIAATIGLTITMILLTMTTAGFIPAVAPLVIAASLIKARFGGIPALELIGPVFRGFSHSRNREWQTNTPWTGTTGDPSHPLAGITVTEEQWLGLDDMAVIWDESAKTAAVVLQVPGVDFALRTGNEQESLLNHWGIALSGFAVEGSPVERICVTQTAHRSSLTDHETWLSQQGTGVRNDLRADYNSLVSQASPETTSHTAHITLVVSSFRLRRSKWGADGKTEQERLLDALKRSASQLTAALHAADLTNSHMLSVDQLALVMRQACDPTTAQAVAPRTGGLAERLGMAGRDRMGPQQTYWHPQWWETDLCAHRTYWIRDWPRQPLPAPWLTAMLSQPGTARRFTVIFRPVQPSVSHRRIDRELTRIHGDTDHKIEKGGRVDATTRRHLQAVEEREEELVSGFAEVAYVGLVTVSADSLEGMENATAAFEASALQAGLGLRPLDHQQDVAWAATLPLGLGINVGRTADF